MNSFVYNNAARLLNAQRWKSIEIPTREEWIVKLLELAEMAKLTYWSKR